MSILTGILWRKVDVIFFCVFVMDGKDLTYEGNLLALDYS